MNQPLNLEKPMSSVTLATLATELEVPINKLAQALRPNVSVDPATGLRVIPSDIARAYLRDLARARERAREAEAQRQAAAEAASGVKEQRRKLKALAARQQEFADGDATALAVMLSADTGIAARLVTAATTRAELAGQKPMTFHKIGE